MGQKYCKPVTVAILIGIILFVAGCAESHKAKGAKSASTKSGEIERKVTAEEVPEAALTALKRMARRAEITEFAEEIEYGHTFYEGSWKKRSGASVDVLVTDTGDLVEIEERIDTQKAPPAVLKEARKAAGKDTELAFEKKTMVLYEVKFTKNGHRHELLLTPDGRRVAEEVETDKNGDGD